MVRLSSPSDVDGLGAVRGQRSAVPVAVAALDLETRVGERGRDPVHLERRKTSLISQLASGSGDESRVAAFQDSR